NKVIEAAQRLGIKSELKSNPGLVLGESEVNLLEMTGAFGVLANQGVANRPHVIRKILDSNECKDESDTSTCRCIYSYFPDQNCSKNGNLEANRKVLEPSVADTMTNMLQAVVRKGTGKPALLSGEEAGKTGTTNDNVDLWFIGYIPNDLVTGVWLGNDDNSPTNGSSTQAAQLWADYMGRISP
ncbi:MAG: penicillin-binding transpeptidase domain-containing protein, partial [Microcoleaceae cyanobacterium]